jgi:arylsulfatase A-like enzyme
VDWLGGAMAKVISHCASPFVRWHGKIASGRVSNEIVHEMDIFTTLAAFVGGKVPTDRAIDSVDKVNSFPASRKRPTERALSSMSASTFLA